MSLTRLADMRKLAIHNFWRQRTRNLIMVGVLALGVCAYLVVVPIMDALAARAATRTTPLFIPGDAAVIISHVVEYRYINEYDSAQSKNEAVCPATDRGREVLPWSQIPNLTWQEFATLETMYTSAGITDVLWAAPTAAWFQKSIVIESGRLPESPNEIILPRWYADRANAAPGSTLTFEFPKAPRHEFNDQKYNVVGIFQTKFVAANLPIIFEEPLHNHSLADLGDLQQRGSNARMLAVLDFGGRVPDMARLRQQIISTFADTKQYSTAAGEFRISVLTGVTPLTPELTARALAADVQVPAVNALFLSFVFVAVGLFTVMLLSFFERKRDIAIMKTVGISNNDVASVFVFEIAIVTVLGVLVGAIMSTFVVSGLSGSQWAGVLVIKRANIFRAAIVGFVVMGFSALFPVSLARMASVNQLLFDQKIYLFHRRIVPSINTQGRRR